MQDCLLALDRPEDLHIFFLGQMACLAAGYLSLALCRRCAYGLLRSVAAAAMLLGLTDTDVDVCLRGGHLRIVKESDGRLFMTGPAREVFRGEIDLECP